MKEKGGELPLLLVLDQIQDPGNLGTIVRTAEGAGVTGIVMSQDCVDMYNPNGSPFYDGGGLSCTILLCR